MARTYKAPNGRIIPRQSDGTFAGFTLNMGVCVHCNHIVRPLPPVHEGNFIVPGKQWPEKCHACGKNWNEAAE